MTAPRVAPYLREPLLSGRYVVPHPATGDGDPPPSRTSSTTEIKEWVWTAESVTVHCETARPARADERPVSPGSSPAASATTPVRCVLSTAATTVADASATSHGRRP